MKMPHILNVTYLGCAKKNASYFNVTYLVGQEECLNIFSDTYLVSQEDGLIFSRYLFGMPRRIPHILTLLIWCV